MESFKEMVDRVLDEIRVLLITKNEKYGNSALNPVRIFSDDSPIEQLLVRIDDKLSRIQRSGDVTTGEDTILDLIGYLILLRIATIQRDKEASAYEASSFARDNLKKKSTGLLTSDG